MIGEWKRNPAVSIFSAGAALLVAVLVAFVALYAGGVRAVPIWLALVLSILSAGGMFLASWGMVES
jgi:hypothetical protein